MCSDNSVEVWRKKEYHDVVVPSSFFMMIFLLSPQFETYHSSVLGDLNDVVHSVTTEIITGCPPWKKLPRTVKESIWDVLLWSTNEVQVRASDRDVTFSHIHNGRYEVLDHILVSQVIISTNPLM